MATMVNTVLLEKTQPPAHLLINNCYGVWDFSCESYFWDAVLGHVLISVNIQPTSNFWLHDTRSIGEPLIRNCVTSNCNTTVLIHYMSATFGILNREFRWKCSVVFSSWKWKKGFSDLLGCHAAVRRRNHSKRREHSSETVISTSIN